MHLIWWGILWAFGRLPEPDRRRFDHGFGWWTPAMRPHWQRLVRNLCGFWRPSLWADLFHSIENIPTEWARQDPQRAQKYYRSVVHYLLAALAVALFA